jgi:uncharacterized protein YjeT (DUF2065 family)
MLRLWIVLLLLLALTLALVSALAQTPPKRLRAAALGLVCAGLILSGLWMLLAP